MHIRPREKTSSRGRSFPQYDHEMKPANLINVFFTENTC